ncbi:hypothetical protein ISF_01159 [Cordyceps fumosorosea ARSEF 2679]|uniref:Rhodopsin domain-containing protein n=1 Tax=Cordyceps fumosorosea (strain ARSEF 2679) TaxID=1081104 RepID=A0A168D2D2_CORFA|nr:hypothetical protein ISF_01159 [Cordyceps fumosorosea ARSEF 2679]OAA72086.1 hypothetical protein ISF_01159 [Cordyceps fumosorosea ARSEF 2679]
MVANLSGYKVPGVPHYEPRAMRVWIILSTSWVTTLAVTSVFLRLLSRRLRSQKLWWDDYLIMFSMMWNWVVLGIGFAMYIEGVGYHVDSVSKHAVHNISKWLLITEIIYIWNLCWTKLSLLMMYYRIFRIPNFKKQVIVVGTFVICWAITISFLFTFICKPIEKLWIPELEGKCVNEVAVWLANAGSTIFSDIVILMLPIPQIWRLNLKKSEKIGLTLVFGLGFFAVFTSSYRTWVLFNYDKNDIPYSLAPLLVWSDVEMCAGIISACLPTLRPVFNAAAKKLGINMHFSRSTPSAPPDVTIATISNISCRKPHVSVMTTQHDPSDNNTDRSPFYRLHDESDGEGMLGETTDTNSISKSTRAESKATCYELRAIDTAGFSEESLEKELHRQRMNRLDA